MSQAAHLVTKNLALVMDQQKAGWSSLCLRNIMVEAAVCISLFFTLVVRYNHSQAQFLKDEIVLSGRHP
ncbi:hypothetical protein NC653_022222 [Populus alba x Populus x berolinensis]|uniref:Uncharacterized protein n=1 Tax=Populus alba x Populus x berolinensis TaxID=444605 RepID=A0AAD6Q991_9ROSI|nr:hypothetical protein NC653_022222 [Populus alba x Populus x berolinensis]